MTTTFKTLKALREKTETAGGGLTRENFISLKSGEQVKVFFRQELAEDGSNYDKANGTAQVVNIHTHPVDFVKKFACTADMEEYGFKCWGCDMARIPGNEKLRSKQRLLVNVLIMQDGEWVPKIFEQPISRRGNLLGNLLVDFQEEYGTLMDRSYRFSRVGEKLNTVYSLIPLSQEDIPAVHNNVDFLPLSVYRVISPDEQEALFSAADEGVNSSVPKSDGDDW